MSDLQDSVNSPADQTPAGPRRSLTARFVQSFFVLFLLSLLVGFALLRFTRIGREYYVDIVELIQHGKLVAAENEAADNLRKHNLLLVVEPPDRHVVSISFMENPIEDGILEQIASLYKLQCVNLTKTNVKDERLECLTGLRHLTSLSAGSTPLTDAAVVHIGQLQNLESLMMRNVKISDKSMPRIAQIPELKILDLSQTLVTDAGLEHLTKLDSLNWLLLQDDNITDAGMVHLEKIPSLKRLSIPGTKVTANGVKRLKKVNPTLSID